MDQLESMRVFVAVADAGGFARAARQLRVSPAAVTRMVAGLEAGIGARLLHRTTRVVRLTEAGEGFLADARRILMELEDAAAAAAGSHGELRGGVSVTASEMFGRMHVAPLALAFLARHAGVTVRTLFVDRRVDLVDEGIDVAVRIGPLPDSALAAVRVGEVRRVVCAAPAYLARRGAPTGPADLAAHDVIAVSSLTPARDWNFAGAAGAARVALAPRFTTNAPDVAIAAVVAGHGVSLLISYMVRRELYGGALVELLPAWAGPPLPVHVVHHAGRRASARVRAFVEHAVATLRAVLEAP